MSPEMRRDFETEWPHLARRLNSFFVRKQVAADRREDLVQETALRLYRIWERVDRTRSAWALTATIALNLIRDEGRRNGHSVSVAELPEIICTDTVEQIALARVELRRIRAALATLTADQRAILLAEVGITTGSIAPATKMRRLRARRKLRQVLERALGLVVLPLRRLTDVGQAFLVVRESFVRVGSCVACMVLGVSSMIALPPEIVVAEPTPDDGTIVIGAPIPDSVPAFHPTVEIDDASFIPDDGTSTRQRMRTEPSAGGEPAGSGAPTQLPLPNNPTPGDDVSMTGSPETEPPVPLPKVPPLPGNEPGDDPQSVDEKVREVEEDLEQVLNG